MSWKHNTYRVVYNAMRSIDCVDFYNGSELAIAELVFDREIVRLSNELYKYASSECMTLALVINDQDGKFQSVARSAVLMGDALKLQSNPLEFRKELSIQLATVIHALADLDWELK